MLSSKDCIAPIRENFSYSRIGLLLAFKSYRRQHLRTSLLILVYPIIADLRKQSGLNKDKGI